MAFDRIHPAAFIPTPDLGAKPFVSKQYALTFPEQWRTDALSLFKAVGKKNPDHIKRVPISRLNAAIGALAPDLVSVASHATVDDTRPWLYATKPFPQHAMDALIQAWLRDLQPDPDANSAVRETWQRLNTAALTWDLTEVNLLEQTLSPGGTAVPAPHLYRLLTDVLAARIESAPPYEYFNEQVSFRRVVTHVSGTGAELMSWPPLRHITKGTGEEKADRVWYYSATITISLRTEPFSPVPRIHVAVGIRRWVAGSSVFMPIGRDVGVYLASKTPLLDGAPVPERFAYAKLHHTKNGEVWANGGPAGMLGRLSATEKFPSAELLRKEPEQWLDELEGITAAVVHHTMMGWHGVNVGIMPSERRRLVEWVGRQLAPEFVPAPDLLRTSFPLRQQNPKGVLEDKEPLKKLKRLRKEDANHSEEEAEKVRKHNEAANAENLLITKRNLVVDANNALILAANADVRRERVTAVVGDRGLVVYLLFQTPEMRDRIIGAAEANLNLTAYREQTGPDIWSWQGPGLAVHIHARRLGGSGGSLGGDATPAKGEPWDEAIRQRRLQVAALAANLAETTGDPAQLAIVELDGEGKFHKRADPKFAIRLGLADAGLVSQFVAIPDVDAEDDKDDSSFRAEAAWADGLRQIGMRFIPEHTLGSAIPERLNQVAFYLIKRRADGPTGKPQFTPIAIMIRPGQNSIMGKTPQTVETSGEWMPYPDLLRALTGQVRGDDLATEGQQAAITSAFVKTTLQQLRGEPTVVYTLAQNMRTRWGWLKNDELTPDRLNFGEGPLQRISLYGSQLRLIRLATTERYESPQWWAPKEGGLGGISKGLWAGPGGNPRVFYSTTEKSSTNTLSMDATKITHRPTVNKQGEVVGEITPGKNASTPGLLQLTMAGLHPDDDPATWAMYTHQQRFSDDYRGGLKLPLALHLAKLAAEYALPHENGDAVGSTDADADVEEAVSREDAIE
jgi:hypothetical protein